MLFLNPDLRSRVFALISVSALLTGCFDQGYSVKSQNAEVQTSIVTATQPTATPAVPTPTRAPSTPTPTATPTTTAVTFNTLKPALAVRAGSCLMCHGQVSANVISDFGYGDKYFFDHDTNNFFDDWGGIYSDWFESASNTAHMYDGTSAWGSALVQGSLIVPKASIDHTFPIMKVIDPLNKSTSMSLAQVLQSPRMSSDGKSIVQPAMISGVSPPPISKAVIEKSQVYIGAATEAEILALAPTLTGPGFKSISVNGVTPNSGLPMSGLQLVNGPNGNYVTNIPGAPFVCAGDVVVRGTLFLNTVTVKTDNNGCRLYVSGSVFVQGQISITGTNTTTQNLQITSARMIAMGFDQTSLGRRLSISGDRTWILNRYKLRNGLDPASWHQTLWNEGAGVPNRLDASDPANPSSTVSFTGLLLNAPEVHSRYTGNFNGAVVAEIAIFRLEAFVFTFDSIFQKAPIFPALSKSILSTTD